MSSLATLGQHSAKVGEPAPPVEWRPSGGATMAQPRACSICPVHPKRIVALTLTARLASVHSSIVCKGNPEAVRSSGWMSRGGILPRASDRRKQSVSGERPRNTAISLVVRGAGAAWRPCFPIPLSSRASVRAVWPRGHSVRAPTHAAPGGSAPLADAPRMRAKVESLTPWQCARRRACRAGQWPARRS